MEVICTFPCGLDAVTVGYKIAMYIIHSVQYPAGVAAHPARRAGLTRNSNIRQELYDKHMNCTLSRL